MEEAKASAYYDELTRKGQGAAKFKQGLGFSSSSSSHSTAATASTAKSSFYNNFVCASNTNPSTASPPDTVKPSNHNHLEAIRNKLKKKPSSVSRENPLEDPKDRKDDRRGSCSRHRSRSRERSRRCRDEEEEGSKSNRRHHCHGGSRRRNRSRSPRSRNGRSHGDSRRCDKDRTTKNVDDYSRLIDGYAQMTTAEKVKAKMKFQLSQTAKKDIAKGINTGWERFDFNKDAPLDDDEELTEVAEDDASIVKDMGKSFRFSAVEAKHEDEIRAAHDQAIFGTPAALSVFPEEETVEPNETKENDKATNTTTTLICDTIITKPQGSWRDRVRKVQDG